jgi:2-hydroxycyclohexanecarboxyl-CoA dehydrogenase
MLGLSGKRAIVTGGASGIGRSTVLRLVKEGCQVGIFDLDEAGTAETIKQASGSGKAFGYKVDITDYAAVQQAVQKFESEAGPIDFLANVAGWDKASRFLDSDQALWDKVIRINLYGPLNLQHIVVRGMAERGFGRVVNVASDAGRVGSSGESIYSACKGGIIAFTKTLAREMARKKITANTVCPGPTDTPLFQSFGDDKLRDALTKAIPLGRLGHADDLPGIIAFLFSDDARFITGQTISVSGGLTMS